MYSSLGEARRILGHSRSKGRCEARPVQGPYMILSASGKRARATGGQFGNVKNSLAKNKPQGQSYFLNTSRLILGPEKGISSNPMVWKLL